MNTNYKNFNYNTDFIPIYNIFNTNTIRGNVGIGTSNPTNNLHVIGNTSSSQNILIKGNLNYEHYSLKHDSTSLLTLSSLR